MRMILAKTVRILQQMIDTGIRQVYPLTIRSFISKCKISHIENFHSDAGCELESVGNGAAG